MALFGGLCPAPYRLGGDSDTGWTAQQHSRFCADLVAAYRSAPFAVVTVTLSGGSYTLDGWKCKAPETSDNTPTVADGDTVKGVAQTTKITFPAAPYREDGERETLSLKSASVSRWDDHQSMYVYITAPNVIEVRHLADTEYTFTVVAYGTWGEPELSTYGADLEKENVTTEQVPYSWIWYNELGASLGSAFGDQLSGRVHGRKISLARALSGCSRAEERKRLQSTPHTAQGPFQKQWADVMRVPFSETLSEPALRRRNATHFAAQSGQDVLEIEGAASELLGDMFLSVSTFDVTDADGTWPSSYDLGPGLWAGTRSKIIVNVDVPAGNFDPAFTNLVNVQLMQMLDVLTPAWVVYDWADPGGFFLDESLLDYDGL